MDQPLDPLSKQSAVQSDLGSNSPEFLSDNALEFNSPAFQEKVDRLIEYVSEQIELLAFDEDDVAQLEQLVRQLIESLVDPRRAQRIQLVDALGQIGEPATPFLLDALDSHLEPVVRRACCHALSHIGDETAVIGLVTALAGDQDISVKSAAAGALAKIGAPAFDALRDLLASPTVDESCKGHVAWAIASMSNEVSARLYESVNDPSPMVRTAVVSAIAQIAQSQIAQGQSSHSNPSVPQSPSSPPLSSLPLSLLIQSLNDTSSDVRIEAIAHLARLNYQAARGPLVSCLQDQQWEVRKAAVLALGKLCSSASSSAASHDVVSDDVAGNLMLTQAGLVETITRLEQDPVEAVQQAATFVVSQLDTASR